MNHNILLIGNPNVGKSSLYNKLTGKKEHTGNWIGKTIKSTNCSYIYKNKKFTLYDLPGIYSINTYTEEENVTRDFLLSNNYDLILLVTDYTHIEKNLHLVLQILEYTKKVILVINQSDLSIKNKITINKEKLSKELGVKVLETSVTKNIGIELLKEEISKNLNIKEKNNKLKYDKELEDNINILIEKYNINRWTAIKILEESKLKNNLIKKYKLSNKINNDIYLNKYQVFNIIEDTYQKYINNIINNCIKRDKYRDKSDKIDKIITNKILSIPITLLFLSLIFYLTIVFTNVPSSILFKLFNYLENIFLLFLKLIKIPNFIIEFVINGPYKTLTWVVSVMFPPMAIFFPLFAFFEEIGFLPRIAFNLDGIFNKCKSCGKQSVVMMMGFGCNAVGIMNSRIIESKKERIVSIITNSFIPCNGRFPMILTVIAIFLGSSNIINLSILLVYILLSFIITLIVTYILSITLYKDKNRTSILELPKYKTINVLKCFIDSFKNKTLKILDRAVKVSIPSGIIIYLLANININGITILSLINNFLDPFARTIGLDGVILTAFLLALPANEIVIPIMIMSYLKLGSMSDMNNLIEFKKLLINNGWTIITAINFIILTIFHFPCSTTLITIYKETKSKQVTLLSFIIPLIIGLTLAFIVKNVMLLII